MELEPVAMSERSARTEEMAIDLGALWGAFWRARFWLVPVLVAVAVVSYLGLSSLPPKYRSEAKLLIEARGSRIDAGQRDPEAERTLLDQEGVTSQVQLISSRDLGRRVVQKEKLDEVPELRGGAGLLRTLLPFLKRGGGDVSPEQQVLDAYFDRLNVYAVEKSRVIAVEFVAGDPALAARVANALVREYLAFQAEAKVSTSSDASAWLESEITGLRGKVAEAEAKVEQWRASHDLFATNRDGTLVEQQLSGLNTQVSQARADKASIEARVDQLRKVLASGALDASADLQTSTSYQRLRERETQLRSRLAELSATLLSGHPQIRALNAQLADIQTQQRGEARRILAALESEVKVADQKLRDIRGELGDGKANAAKANENDIQLRALEREAKAQRDLLETFLARYREAISRQNDRALPPDARAISEASAASAPFFPKVLPLTFLVTFAAFMILTAFIILRELVSGRAVRPAAWQPAAEAPPRTEPVLVTADGAPVAAESDSGTDPEDPGPGGRWTPPRLAKHDDTPALVAAAREAGNAAAAQQAQGLTEPEEIGWAVDDSDIEAAADARWTAAAEEADAIAAQAEDGDEAGEAVTLAVADIGFAPEDEIDAAEPPAVAAAALDDVLTGRFQAGGRMLAVVAPPAAPPTRAAALVAVRRAAGLGRACLVEWAAHATPLGDGPGVADLLAGRAGFDAVIAPDAASTAHLVPAGDGLGEAQLGDPALALILDALGSCYDRLVIDVGVADVTRPGLMARLHGMDTVIVAVTAAEAAAGERLRQALQAAGLDDVVVAAVDVQPAPARDAA
jgi:uncharacterized protein involved in exopolysaccharide biosynthesis